jgi:arginyl-tRNA synthetase
MKQFNLVALVLYLILAVILYEVNTACLRDENNNDLTYIIYTHARRIKVHKKNTIKQKEHERRKKEEEEREEKRRLFFVQNLEARLVASSVLRDFYAGRF